MTEYKSVVLDALRKELRRRTETARSAQSMYRAKGDKPLEHFYSGNATGLSALESWLDQEIASASISPNPDSEAQLRQLEEARDDTKRLDWLDKYTETWREIPGIVQWLKSDIPKDQRTLRSAIDAAMSGGITDERDPKDTDLGK